jgi:hypothetical protein
MQLHDRIIEQTDTLAGKIAQTIQRPDGTDYVREVEASVTIDYRVLQTLTEIAALFADTSPEPEMAQDAVAEASRLLGLAEITA